MKKILAAGLLAMSLLTASVQGEDVLTPTKPVAKRTWLQEIVAVWHQQVSRYF